MTASMLLRLAWRQSLIRLVLYFAALLAIGGLLGAPWWALGLGAAALAARAYWRLYRVLRFLDWRRQLRTVDVLYSSEDQLEGARAFAEKRDPVWKGR